MAPLTTCRWTVHTQNWCQGLGVKQEKFPTPCRTKAYLLPAWGLSWSSLYRIGGPLHVLQVGNTCLEFSFALVWQVMRGGRARVSDFYFLHPHHQYFPLTPGFIQPNFKSSHSHETTKVGMKSFLVNVLGARVQGFLPRSFLSAWDSYMQFLSLVLQLFAVLLWLLRAPQFLTCSSDMAKPRNTKALFRLVIYKCWPRKNSILRVRRIHTAGRPSQRVSEKRRAKIRQYFKKKGKHWTIPIYYAISI